MATPETIAELRSMIGEPDPDSYTDDVLSARIDASRDLNELAAEIWREKAAAVAGLVDVTEGNSTRSLGNLYKQALAMAAQYQSRVTSTSTTPTGRVTRIRPIERV